MPPARPSSVASSLRALLLALVTIAVALSPAPAGAAPQTIGSSLAQTANLPFGCEARPQTTAITGQIQLLQTRMSSCMWWQAGVSAASTYIPRGQGTVVAARVKVGANPAPLRISIISSGGGGCCTQQSRSEIFQPAPNAITEVPLNLAAGSGIDPTRTGGQYNDIAVVTAVGPGSLPVHDYGTYDFTNLTIPAAAFLHPELTNGNSNTDVGYSAGFEVLLQVDWCGTAGTGSTATGARARVVAPAPPTGRAARRIGTCPSPPPSATPAPAVTPAPGPTTPPAVASVSASRLTAAVSKGKAAVRLRCATAACGGSVVLRRADKKRTLLGRKATFSLVAGGEGSVKVELTAAGKAALKARKKVAADAVVTFSDGRTQTLRVTLR